MAFLGNIGAGGSVNISGNSLVPGNSSAVDSAYRVVTVGALPVLVTDQGIDSGLTVPYIFAPTGGVTGAVSQPSNFIIGRVGP